MGYSLPSSSVHGILLGKNTGVGCHFLLKGLFPNPGIEPGSPALQEDLLSMNIFNFLNIIKPAQSKV